MSEFDMILDPQSTLAAHMPGHGWRARRAKTQYESALDLPDHPARQMRDNVIDGMRPPSKANNKDRIQPP